MPALKPTEFTATVTWIGHVRDSTKDLRAEAVPEVALGFEGLPDSGHAGLTRPSCSRVTSQHPRGTEIRNTRQLSVVSAEELTAIANEMGLDSLDPLYIGASLVIEGIPDFSRVPPSSRLQNDQGTTIAVDMENRPCVLPGREIDKDFPGLGPGFKAAARDRRGVTAWVERPGPLAIGDVLRLHIPDQPVWAHLDAARGD